MKVLESQAEAKRRRYQGKEGAKCRDGAALQPITVAKEGSEDVTTGEVIDEDAKED